MARTILVSIHRFTFNLHYSLTSWLSSWSPLLIHNISYGISSLELNYNTFLAFLEPYLFFLGFFLADTVSHSLLDTQLASLQGQLPGTTPLLVCLLATPVMAGPSNIVNISCITSNPQVVWGSTS